MQDQLIKMAAAALGISQEDVIATVKHIMEFVSTANERLEALEKQSADMHRMITEMYTWEGEPGDTSNGATHNLGNVTGRSDRDGQRPTLSISNGNNSQS